MGIDMENNVLRELLNEIEAVEITFGLGEQQKAILYHTLFVLALKELGYTGMIDEYEQVVKRLENQQTKERNENERTGTNSGK